MNDNLRMELRKNLVVSRRLLERAAIERCRRMESVRFPFDGYLSASHLGNPEPDNPKEKFVIPIVEMPPRIKEIKKSPERVSSDDQGVNI